MKLTIKSKFILTGFVLIIISISFLGWFSIRHERNTLKTELDERAISLVNNLATNSIYGVVTFNRDDLARLANNVLNQKDVIFVQILSRGGIVLAEVGNKVYKEEQAKEFSVPIISEKQVSEAGEEMILDFEEEVKKEEIGKVKIVVSLSSFIRKANELKRTVILVIVAVVIVVIIFITLAVNKYIGIPIKNLISATQKISSGDLNYKINVSYEDELGELAVFFNKMTEDLKNSMDKVEEYSRTLEEKVEERTKELKESQEKLVQTSKMAAVGQLAGGVAHEINNPMGVILGFSQSVVKMIKEDNPLYMPLKSIEREAVRCKKMITDLLTFSRKEKTHSEIVTINETVEETLSLVQAQTKVKNIKVVKEYGTGLPQIEVNKNQIQQVIMNLCNNAIDAMKDGGELTIKTQIADGSDKTKNIIIKISDNGEGIPKDNLDKIFEPFFTTKQVGKGTGLGLSLCYEIIQKHNGTIEVESPTFTEVSAGREVGKGTTFIIKLPVKGVIMKA